MSSVLQHKRSSRNKLFNNSFRKAIFAYLLILLLTCTDSISQGTVSCADSSLHLHYKSAQHFSVMQHVNSIDGGRILLGTSLIQNQAHAVVIKFKEDGAILWSKKITPTPPYTNLFINQLCEAGNGNIALAGQINQQYYYLAVLDQNGQMIKQSIPNFTNIPLFNTISKETHIITRLSADSLLFLYYLQSDGVIGDRINIVATDNSGNVGWSQIYTAPNTNYNQMIVNAAKLDGRFLWLYGTVKTWPFCVGQNNESSILFLKIDLTSKQAIIQKQYCTPLAPNALLFPQYDQLGVAYRSINGKYYFDDFFFLENNKIAVTRGYRFMSLAPKTTNYLYHITYYDSLLSPLKSFHLVTDSILLNERVFNIRIDSNGKQQYCFTDYKSKTIYYAVADSNNKIFHQKKITWTELGALKFPTRLQTSENRNFIELTTQSAPADFTQIDYVRINASDTAELCFGEDTSFLRFEPATVTPYQIIGMINSEPGILQETALPFLVENYPMLKENICIIKNICDTLKIHAPDTLCNITAPVLVTAHKNPLCKGKINFQFDTLAVNSWQQLNDTSIQIHFKDQWQGYIHATASSCPSLRDSFFITVSKALPDFNLGSDTTYCEGRTYRLKAPYGMKQYAWQDGSSDSIFTAFLPGKYFVTFMDHCNRMYSDTLEIKPFSYNLTAGNDRMICKSESTTLNVSSGFLNYTWEPAYNISNTTGKSVTVFPERTTAYTVTAEFFPDCFLKDTVLIEVEDCPQKFFIPSAFTPDNNGRNDDFKPIIEGALVNYEFTIYNRWGQVVFTSREKGKGWSGTLNGAVQSSGSFVWTCRFQFYNRAPEMKKGVVTLIK